MFVCRVPKISHVKMKRRISVEILSGRRLKGEQARARETREGLGCSHNFQAPATQATTAAELLHNSVDLLCGTTTAELLYNFSIGIYSCPMDPMVSIGTIFFYTMLEKLTHYLSMVLL